MSTASEIMLALVINTINCMRISVYHVKLFIPHREVKIAINEMYIALLILKKL